MPLGFHCLSNCRGPVQQKIKATELEYIICLTTSVEFVNGKLVISEKIFKFYYLQIISFLYKNLKVYIILRHRVRIWN